MDLNVKPCSVGFIVSQLAVCDISLSANQVFSSCLRSPVLNTAGHYQVASNMLQASILLVLLLLFLDVKIDQCDWPERGAIFRFNDACCVILCNILSKLCHRSSCLSSTFSMNQTLWLPRHTLLSAFSSLSSISPRFWKKQYLSNLKMKWKLIEAFLVYIVCIVTLKL